MQRPITESLDNKNHEVYDCFHIHVTRVMFIGHALVVVNQTSFLTLTNCNHCIFIFSRAHRMPSKDTWCMLVNGYSEHKSQKMLSITLHMKQQL